VGFRPNSERVVCADDAPRFAISTAFSSWSIKELVTVNGTVALPATGWTRGGTLICVLLDESRMPALLAGAAPERVIWQALVPPPIKVCVAHAMAVTDTFELVGPSRVSICDTPWLGALIVTDVVEDTEAAVAVNVALLKPAPMVMEFGMVTLALVDISAISVFVCAGLLRVNVHVLEPGVWMVVGEHTRLAVLDAGLMVIVAVRVAEPAVAVMVALPVALALAAALKPADDCPAAIMTDAGTFTCGLLLLSDTVTPPAVGLLSDTVQLLVAPGAMVPGAQLTLDRPAAG